MATIQSITPCLWFDRQAEEAAKFYTSIFPHSSVGRTSRYGKEGFEVHKMPEGTVLTIEFTLNGNPFVGLNGGPIFKFTEAVSFMVSCKDQEELDYYWNKLSEGGDPKAQQCGWLKDKFGLSWQIVPSILPRLMDDKSRAGRVMSALMQMKKLDIKALEEA
jgi:predicted 3-demethylubiquinone-9 3-methyltransferase (glyoxalase superfamily)